MDIVLDRNVIVKRLKSLGLVEVGKPGRRSYFEYTDGKGGERIGVSAHLGLARSGATHGSLYVHDPGVLVATGELKRRLENVEPHNGVVGGKPGVEKLYPAWRDRPSSGHRALTDLLSGLTAAQLR